jgi:putative ABC transport system substrate-binding protein
MLGEARRPTLLALLAVSLIALSSPPLAEVQEVGKVYRIGHVSLMTPEGMAPYVQEFEKGLRDLGYVKGRNYVIEDRSAKGKPELVEPAAAELVRLKVDVILTGINQGVAAARKATITIPIVMVYGIDPVGAGFVQSLARPGGNVTGGAFEAAPEIYGKKLQLLKEIKPGLARVALLWNPAYPGSMTYMTATKDAARQLGVRFQSVEVRAPGELETAFAAISKARSEAVIVVGDPITFPARAQIAMLAIRYRVPFVASWREFAEAGALLSYGPNSLERWRRAAVYVDKLLKGASASELPVEQPATFELVVNLKVAKELGITIPESLAQRADRMIE